MIVFAENYERRAHANAYQHHSTTQPPPDPTIRAQHTAFSNPLFPTPPPLLLRSRGRFGRLKSRFGPLQAHRSIVRKGVDRLKRQARSGSMHARPTIERVPVPAPASNPSVGVGGGGSSLKRRLSLSNKRGLSCYVTMACTRMHARMRFA